MLPAGKKAKRLSSVIQTTKAIHQDHYPAHCYPIYLLKFCTLCVTSHKIMQGDSYSLNGTYPFLFP